MNDEDHTTCLDIIKKLKGSSTKVRRANILLKADADGHYWNDQDIADAFLCSRQTVENVRKRLVTEGFDIALNGKKREVPASLKRLDGKQEADVIALRLSEPPKGRNAWTLRLNIAENELSALTVQCVRGVRFGTIEELRAAVEAWAVACNANQKGVDGQFTPEKARIKLKTLYPKIVM